MQTHEQVIEQLMSRPGVRAEVERIERDEPALLGQLLKARHDARLSQAQLAERMGKQAPSLATLRTYAQACGRRWVLGVA